MAALLLAAATTSCAAPPAAVHPAPSRLGAGGELDSDGDGLSDYAEVHKYRTDPGKRDTAGDGVSDAEWARRKEFTYTITTVFRVLKPASPADMNDDYQDARVITEDADSYTLEIVHYPLNTNEAIGENPNWRRDYAGMTEWLKPTVTANWDERMRADLLAALRSDGIDPDALTDRALVERVSRWALKRSTTSDVFSIWFVELDGGAPRVAPELRAAFDRQRKDAAWSDQDMFAREVLGKEMFYGKVRGSCTSSTVYLTAILRALGIPTRVVVFAPAADPNDDRQVEDLVSHIRHHKTRAAVETGLRGLSSPSHQAFVDHFMNEVFVGGRWVRLNYDKLGQNIVDARFLGLMTHVATAGDIADLRLWETWGKRQAKGANESPRLSSINPYMLLTAPDHFGAHARVDNPAAPAMSELRAVTIASVCWAGTPCVPDWITKRGKAPELMLLVKEWLPDQDYRQMRVFEGRVGRAFVLKAAGRPDVHVTLDGAKLSDGHGTFQAFGVKVADADRASFAAGVDYSLEPVNTSPVYRWVVAPGVVVKRP